ncbi:MAG: hypothetical protein M3O46_16945, partial [Myxococcota bacterium]|nr:hypothetical protein [Myxococcota bacterium]
MRRALFLIALLFACRKPPVGGAGGAPDAATDMPAGAGVIPGTHSVLPARCRATDLGISVDDGGGLDDLEFGDAVATAEGYGVGIVRRTPTGRMAAVVLVRDGVVGARVVDLGPTPDEASPPRLASCGKELVAAAYVLPGAVSRDSGAPSGHQVLMLYGVSHVPEPSLLSIPQAGGDSLGVDLACSGGGKGLAVWDETTNAPHGLAAQGPV